METEERKRKAVELFQQAYQEHLRENIEAAERLYQASLAYYPTAEAHTFLGWAYSAQDRTEEAIVECKKAIRVDPTLGNPYNDIGSYLIKLERFDEAVPWLNRAIKAERYEARHYPHCNLGRVYWQKGQLRRALDEYRRALALAPDYAHAAEAVARIEQQLN